MARNDLATLDPVRDLAFDLRTKSDTLRFFVKQSSPQILIFVGTILSAARVMLGRLSLDDLLVLAIVPTLWHIQERLIHEYLLHPKRRTLLPRRMLRRTSRHHRRHHLDPWRTDTLFITSSAYLFTVPTVALTSLAVTRDVRLALSATFAYFATLLVYEWAHCLIHTSYVPRTRWFQRRWKNHRLHHFRNSRYWFGITSPFWDSLFRSRPNPSHVQIAKNWRGPCTLETLS
jgi:sterol desaturase/sphingolipid hydroxylase (fatty acid hydroxylase superfamily)